LPTSDFCLVILNPVAAKRFESDFCLVILNPVAAKRFDQDIAARTGDMFLTTVGTSYQSGNGRRYSRL
jgi:uncharacterized protein (DUF169 family)